MAVDYPNLTWSQTAPGVWQRGIDEIEQIYAALAILYEGSGRMYFGMTGFLSLSVDVPTLSPADQEVDKALEKAWLAIRYDHPTIASQVTRDNETQEWTKTYHQFRNESDRTAWLEQTLVHISTGQTSLQWANSDPPAPKVPTLFVVHPPPDSKDQHLIRRDLVFRSPHDIIDGIGTLMLFNNLLHHTSAAYRKGDGFELSLCDGSEVANLSPPYRVSAGIPLKLAPAQQRRLKEIIAQKAEVASNTEVKILTLPYKHGALTPGRHQRVALTLSKEETTQLLAACKKIDATPTHVFHAAAAMVLRDVQSQTSEEQRVRYINYILRNERASCRDPFNSSQHPAAVYHSVSGDSLVVDMIILAKGDLQNMDVRKREFERIVQTMKDFYHGVRNDKDHYALVPDLWSLGLPTLPSTPRPFPIPPPKEFPSVSISSMGRVDAIIKQQNGVFRVNDAWVTGEELGNGLGLFLGTFNGELCLSAAYNDAWHEEVDVLDYLNRCKEIVFTSLELKTA